jgi:hypothetical protein
MTGAPRPDNLRRAPTPELAVACPYCHARPGTRCTNRRGRYLTDTHASRKEARR